MNVFAFIKHIDKVKTLHVAGSVLTVVSTIVSGASNKKTMEKLIEAEVAKQVAEALKNNQ